MHKLIQLEKRKFQLRSYLFAALWIAVGSLIFLYMISVIPKLEQGVPVEMFESYRSLQILLGIIQMCAYSVLSGVMYSRIVVEEYTGKRATLLFSYPVNRKKIFTAKIIIVVSCTAGFMIVSNLFLYGIFYGTETLFPLVADKITFSTIAYAAFTTLIFSILAAAIGIIGARIGFYKKSVPVTILAPLLICFAIGNILSLAIQFYGILFAITSVFLVAGGLVLAGFAKKIDTMEEIS